MAVVAVALGLTPLGACLSNPTPHPEIHGDVREGWDTGLVLTDDQDPDKDNGADALTETPGGFDGADVLVGDIDPNASVTDVAGGDGVGADGEASDDDASGGEADYDNGGEVVPTTPNDDFSSCGGGNPPITDP